MRSAGDDRSDDRNVVQAPEGAGEQEPNMKAFILRGVLLGFLLGLVIVTSGALPRRRHDGAGGGLYKSLGTFSEVLSLVQSNYVEPVENEKLFMGAFGGLTGALDSSCDFIPSDKISEFRRQLEHPASGVGVLLTRRGGYAGVAAVVPGSPAAEAKLVGGELLEAIDGHATRGMALWEAESAMRGPEGSFVTISILRPYKSKRESIKLERKNIVVPGPKTETREGTLIFHPAVLGSETARALDAALAKSPTSVVLDLRDCGGDDLNAAAAVAARLSGGGIAFAKEDVRRGEAREWKTPAVGSFFRGPVAVATDGGTSDGAEVLAGFLAAQSRAKAVGEPTSGLTGRRRLVALPSGGAIYLTVARIRPAGAARAIDGAGLEPAEEVLSRPEAEGESKDPILDRAIEIVRDKGLPKKAA